MGIQYELCDGYAVLHLVDTSAKEVEVIISTYQGARELVDAAGVIMGAMARDREHAEGLRPFRFECWTEADYIKRIQRGDSQG
jgi:hypothetical protein